jgi:Kef-type K+ transport system membrane component KefB
MTPLPILAAPAGPDGHSITLFLTAIAAVLLLTKVLGDVAQRFGQPAVLGELIAGIVLGPSVIGLLNPADPVIFSLSELGVLILLFEIGLHTDLRSILKVGSPAVTVGIVGVVVPFAGGYGAALALGISGLAALVCGAALTATSIGISARVLADLNALKTMEGQIVLGAAVLDDVIGLIILSVISGLAAGGVLTLAGVSQIVAVALGFLVLALVVGYRAAPLLVRLADGMRVDGALGSIALAFALALAAAAGAAGSAMIIGAFAAGLVFGVTPKGKEIEKATARLGHFFVPIFFAAVGASINLASLADRRVLLVGGVLCVVAVLGKLVSGFAPWWLTSANKTLIGVAMIPRGEVGLIFAQMGLATGALDEGMFSAVVLMVMVTTFIAPPWLAALVGKPAVPLPRADEGIDALVTGERKAGEK